MKSQFKFTYKSPKLIYDKEQDRSYIEIFGGRRKYFDSEDAYDLYVKKDEKIKYKKFLQDSKEKQEYIKKMDQEKKFPGLSLARARARMAKRKK